MGKSSGKDFNHSSWVTHYWWLLLSLFVHQWLFHHLLELCQLVAWNQRSAWSWWLGRDLVRFWRWGFLYQVYLLYPFTLCMLLYSCNRSWTRIHYWSVFVFLLLYHYFVITCFILLLTVLLFYREMYLYLWLDFCCFKLGFCFFRLDFWLLRFWLLFLFRLLFLMLVWFLLNNWFGLFFHLYFNLRLLLGLLLWLFLLILMFFLVVVCIYVILFILTLFKRLLLMLLLREFVMVLLFNLLCLRGCLIVLCFKKGLSFNFLSALLFVCLYYINFRYF